MRVEHISESFNIDIGAPSPTILSNEHHLFLVFYVNNVSPNWRGKTVNIRSNKDTGIRTIKFKRFAQFRFGEPNDEAIEGHPYYSLGLKPYAIQQVIDSDWIENLIRMNSIHPCHKDEHYKDFKHYIFFFHDTCFEIAATGYSIEKNLGLSLSEEVQRIAQEL